MEVRSTEQCGTATAQTAATTAAATTEATAVATTNNNMSMDFKLLSSADGTRAAVNMDLSRTTVNDETRPPLTRDESEYKNSFLFATFWMISVASRAQCASMNVNKQIVGYMRLNMCIELFSSKEKENTKTHVLLRMEN